MKETQASVTSVTVSFDTDQSSGVCKVNLATRIVAINWNGMTAHGKHNPS